MLSFGILAALILLFYSFFFLAGYFHEGDKKRFSFFRRLSIVIDPDWIFGKLSKEIVLNADLLAFWTCITLIPLVLLTALLSAYLKNKYGYISGFLFLAGLIMPWLIRVVYILKYKNKINFPKFWPYRYY